MMNTFIHTTRKGFKMMMGAFILLHLTPLISMAGAAAYTPYHETRIIDRDIIKLSDVFEHVDLARDQTIGAAPRPGQDMVLNARTLMKLAVAYNVKWQPSTTQDQITLRRDGTVIDTAAIESAVKSALIEHGAPENFAVTFDAPLQPFLMNKTSNTNLTADQVSLDPNTSRFHLTISAMANPNQIYTLNGKIEPIILVPVAAKTIVKGDIIGTNDIDMTEMRANQVKNDMHMESEGLIGLTARHTIIAGRMVKESDVEIPLSINRGDKITLIYQSGGMELAAQGRAMQDGRRGDRVKVINTTSNKNLQGTVIADNRVVID